MSWECHQQLYTINLLAANEIWNYNLFIFIIQCGSYYLFIVLKSIYFREWEVIWEDWERKKFKFHRRNDVWYDIIAQQSSQHSAVPLAQYSYLWMMYYQRVYNVRATPSFSYNKCEAGFKFVSVILL